MNKIGGVLAAYVWAYTMYTQCTSKRVVGNITFCVVVPPMFQPACTTIVWTNYICTETQKDFQSFSAVIYSQVCYVISSLPKNKTKFQVYSFVFGYSWSIVTVAFHSNPRSSTIRETVHIRHCSKGTQKVNKSRLRVRTVSDNSKPRFCVFSAIFCNIMIAITVIQATPWTSWQQFSRSIFWVKQTTGMLETWKIFRSHLKCNRPGTCPSLHMKQSDFRVFSRISASSARSPQQKFSQHWST